MTASTRSRPLALVAALAVLLTLAPTGQASAQQADPAERTVSLVQRPDGSLEVVTGPSFAAVTGTVLVTEADTVLHPAGRTYEYTSSGTVTDELRPEQWNLDDLQAERVWQAVTGEDQVIAIVDTGVDGDHPDLADRLVEVWSATGRDELVDDQGHGTHVAGIAAASVGDDYGVAGLAPEAGLMSVQVTGEDGSAYASDVSRGVIWAADHGATVINISLAGPRESQVLNAAIDHAVDAGVVVVVAAGNAHGNGNPVMYPASHPRVLAVGALRDAETRSAFSSTGDYVDIAAPGSAIMSTRPRDAWGYASGTSMAAPLVAGAAALLRSHDSSLSVDEVHALLMDSARDLGRKGHDDDFGAGAVDVIAALTAMGEDLTEPEPEPEPEPQAEVRVPRPTYGHFSRG